MDIVLAAAKAAKRHNYTQMLISGVIGELQGSDFCLRARLTVNLIYFML